MSFSQHSLSGMSDLTCMKKCAFDGTRITVPSIRGGRQLQFVHGLLYCLFGSLMPVPSNSTFFRKLKFTKLS